MLYKYGKQIILFFVLFIITPLITIHGTQNFLLGAPFFPMEISDPLSNPYMGWAPSAEGGPYGQPHQLVYINTTCRLLGFLHTANQECPYGFRCLESPYLSA